MATRRRCPPESSEGMLSMYAARPMNPSTSSTRRHTWSSRNPCSSSLYPTFSATVSESNSAPSWNTIPRSLRTTISSSSVMMSTRSPLTQMMPLSGLRSPTINLRIVDFPAPLAPRKTFVWPLMSVKLTSRRITFSSNASDTRSKTTIGDPGPSASSSSVERSVAIVILVQQRNQQRGQEEIHRDHRDRCDDDGSRRRPADALSTAPGTQADVTANRYDHEAEHERLDQPLPRILKVQGVADGRPVHARADPQACDGNQPTRADAKRVGHHRQHRGHERTRQHAGNDELANGVGAERAKRVDLIGDDH